MKTSTRFFLLVSCLAAPFAGRAENLAVTGDMVYTMAGAPLQHGVVLIRDGKIEAVGSAGTVKIPAGYRVLKAAVVTPGLIDAHATVGLSGLLNQVQDQDMIEKSSSAVRPRVLTIMVWPETSAVGAWPVLTVVTPKERTQATSGSLALYASMARNSGWIGADLSHMSWS